MTTPHRSRRAFLAALALAAAGCRDVFGQPDTPAALPTPSPSSSDQPSPSGVPTATESPTATPPPVPAHWSPTESEVYPNAKTRATRVLHDLLNHELGATATELAARVVPASDPERQILLASALDRVVDEGRWSRAEVVYPQLGGVSEDACSVMVVTRLTTGTPDGDVRTETRTFDVRLDLRDDAWVLDVVDDDGGPPVDRPDDLPPEAVAVLDDPRIVLPDSSRWDVHSGDVDVRLLRAMSRMADFAPYSVATITRGHPEMVFDTDRVSDHTRGRAVDVWAIDGVPVVEDRAPGSTSEQVVALLYDDPDVKQTGSPWARDDRGGRSFTDVVHQDHLHIASGDPRPIPTASPSTSPPASPAPDEE